MRATLFSGSVLGLLGGLLATTASAQTDAAVESFIRQANPGCAASSHSITRGMVDGFPSRVAVAYYVVVGCGGGDNWAAAFGVFVEESGRVRQLRLAPGPRWPVEAARIANGRIVVTGSDYGPNDPRCCPTVPRSASFVVREDVVVAAP